MTKMFLAVAMLASLLGAKAATGQSPFNAHAGNMISAPESRIDQLVKAQLIQVKAQPAALCSDPVFVRRVYLDLTGTIPTAFQAREFILDTHPQKRSALISKLIGDPRFPDYWAMKWSDLLRVKAEFPINLWPNAVQAYHRWIRDSIRDGMPYDQFARELLTASGSNFRVPPVNFYRAVQSRTPEGIAQAVALTFMGCRTDHWTKEQVAGLSACFAQLSFKPTGEWKEEILMFDPSAATNGIPATALLADGTKLKLPPGSDPREIFADWLTNPKNPWFARNLANRAWSWFMGRGIVHEPDDLRASNPPSNPELLSYLERELVRSNYDVKHLFKLILESKTYQSSCIGESSEPAPEANFAFYPIRRLEAEVLIDALNQVTGSSEKYLSPIPEPYTVLPAKMRAVDISDGSITSPFLELFGRPSRDTGLEGERNNRPNAAQALHLLNSTHIQQKIEQSHMVKYQLESGKPLREVVTNVYLGLLSRFPTQQETDTALSYAGNRDTLRRETLVDLVWALINNPEFYCRH